jgi:hypothetical protein
VISDHARYCCVAVLLLVVKCLGVVCDEFGAAMHRITGGFRVYRLQCRFLCAAVVLCASHSALTVLGVNFWQCFPSTRSFESPIQSAQVQQPAPAATCGRTGCLNITHTFIQRINTLQRTTSEYLLPSEQPAGCEASLLQALGSKPQAECHICIYTLVVAR